MGGKGFCHALARHVRQQPAAVWPQLLILVPTARVAARLRALLSEGFTGVLPAILPLKGTPELAEILGFDTPAAVDSVVARLEIARLLRQRDTGDLFDAAEAPDVLEGERLWRRVEGLYTTLNRLALHGVSVRELRAAVPAQMVGLWEHQADTLLRVARHMERWLAARDEDWPGAVERRILERAAEVLASPECPWQPLAAGVVDGVPAARAVLRATAQRGEVLLPEMGPATAELTRQLMEVLDAPVRPLSLAAEDFEEAVAETDWDEAWLAALAVRRAVQAGEARVAVVCPSRTLLQRVAGILAGWNLPVTVGGGLCLSDTPSGREATAAPHWGPRGRKLGQWLELMTQHGLNVAGWDDVTREVQRLQGEDYWLEAADWQAVLRMLLADIPAATAAAEGIFLLGPLEARLLDFDTAIACGCVEGTWPAPAFDSWLSEPHLRALKLPDSAHKALLAGTELESVLHGGHGRTILTRAESSEGKETLRSRFLAGYRGRKETELGVVATRLRRGDAPDRPEALGVFTPHGTLWPKIWSASLIEALLACPYRALGERVLKLAPPDPLTPLPDPRTAGLLVHRWLERIGREDHTHLTSEAYIARMLALGDEELAKEAPVVRAIWRGKFAKLAPALAAQWQADGRRVTSVETRLTRTLGPVTVAATLDRVEENGDSSQVVIDFKTGTPPAWSRVAAGIKPQLALEAWLLGAEVSGVEYWHLRGYGSKPLEVRRADGRTLTDMLAPVEDGMARLMAAYPEGAAFAAVPDLQGGGLQATGVCEYCELAGVCRRKGAVHA